MRNICQNSFTPKNVNEKWPHSYHRTSTTFPLLLINDKSLEDEMTLETTDKRIYELSMTNDR